MSHPDGDSDAGVPMNDATAQPPTRRLAAQVDSGLAGLLAGVLARAESVESGVESESEAEAEADMEAASMPSTQAQSSAGPTPEFEGEGGNWADFAVPADATVEKRWFSVAPQEARTVEPQPTGEPVLSWEEVETAPDWNILPVLDPEPEIATWADADRVLDLDDGAVARTAFRWSDESLSGAPATASTVQPVAEPRLVLTPVDLEPQEEELLLEGLSRVRARAGEEGLPFAVVHLELSGAGLGPGTGEVTRRYIQSIVRDGDIVVRLDDRSVAMMCGGLFFPGDMEVVGERIRMQLYQSCQVLFNVDYLTVVVAGALMAAGEDLREFLTRGASARFHATAHRRTDVLIDYVSHSLSR